MLSYLQIWERKRVSIESKLTKNMVPFYRGGTIFLSLLLRAYLLNYAR